MLESHMSIGHFFYLSNSKIVTIVLRIYSPVALVLHLRISKVEFSWNNLALFAFLELLHSPSPSCITRTRISFTAARLSSEKTVEAGSCKYRLHDDRFAFLKILVWDHTFLFNCYI